MRNNLKQCRLRHGLSQKQLAEALKITTTQYQRIETGKSDGSMGLWISIKKILDDTIDNLIVDVSI